jgi:hypothetical protein
MDRKQDLYLALGLTVGILACIAAWLAVPGVPPFVTTFLSTRTPISATTPTLSATEASNWAIVFEYQFPADFWTVGTHEYTLESDCPSIQGSSGTRTQMFEVSEDATLLSNKVYLRVSGLRDSTIEGASVAQIHPSQSTSAVFSLIDATRSEAELAMGNCRVTVKWDGQSPIFLTPGLPFRR